MSTQQVSEAFNANEIIPDVIDISPGEILELTYGSKKVALGNSLTPTEVQHQPIVKWNANPGKYYVLAMVDPDEFNREEHTLREFKHWLVVNIPGDDISKGEVLAAFIGSGPPKDSGLHRYVFLVYEQPEKLTFDEKKLPSTSPIKDRVLFSIRSFAQKYKLGKPVAGNFYQAEWDPYVEKLLATLDED